MIEQRDTQSAILVRERGALWPGSMLDWAKQIQIVEQSRRDDPDRLLARIRRAAAALARRSLALSCVVVSFADVLPAPRAFRASLVRGLGRALAGVDCSRLVLAAYNVERTDVSELLELQDIQRSSGSAPMSVELLFRTVSYGRPRETRREGRR